jgi:ribosomal protein S18 acetylase RimI-like enzyme
LITVERFKFPEINMIKMDSSIVINLETSADFTDEDCTSLQLIRNEEYPTVLEQTTFEKSKKWLKNPDRASKYITARNTSIKSHPLVGILTFSEHIDFPDCTWFSMVIRRDYQRQGIGKKMLNLVKSLSNELRAYAVEHNNYVKKDGTTYLSPLGFYKMNGFVKGEKILKTESGLECVEIIWRKKTDGNL